MFHTWQTSKVYINHLNVQRRIQAYSHLGWSVLWKQVMPKSC